MPVGWLIFHFNFDFVPRLYERIIKKEALVKRTIFYNQLTLTYERKILYI